MAGPVLPVAKPASGTVASGATVVIDVLALDTGTGISLTALGTPVHGTASIVGGKISYTANADYAGVDQLSYTITDSLGQAAASIAAVTVVPPSDAVPVKPTVFSPALVVAQNGPTTAIGIALPADPAYPAMSLVVTIGTLPSTGGVSLPDGTVITAGQVLTAQQLAALQFTPAPGTAGVSSTLSYTVADPAGHTATGTATLVIGPAQGHPVAGTVQVTVAIVPVPLAIAPPLDGDYATSMLLITLTGLPTNGTVSLADGTAVDVNQVMTAAQLAGLVFSATPGAYGSSSALTYTVRDPAGALAAGMVGITVLGATTAPPVLTLASGASQAILDEATAVLSGTATPGALITLSGGLGSAQAGADGSFIIVIPLADVPLTGSRLSITATAALAGFTLSPPSAAVSLLVLSPPGADGFVPTDVSSIDIADALHAGYRLQLTAATEALNLVDGVLSVGVNTQEAFLQRLYEGLLGRSYETGGMEAWVAALASGRSLEDVAQGFLNSAEYQTRPQPRTEPEFIISLYQSFLGRDPVAPELSYWLEVGNRGLGHAQIVASFGTQPEAKIHLAATTARVFARRETATAVHDIYKTALGREAELGGLATWTGVAGQGGLQAVAALFLLEPETAGLHARQSNADYVRSLYLAGLGRAASDTEVSYGAGQLDAGLSRGAFLQGVALSPEARAHLTSDDFNSPAPILALPAAAAAATIAPSITQPAARPALLATAPAAALVNTQAVVSLSGGGRVTGWTVLWGDGSAAMTVAGDVAEAQHSYTAPGTYAVQTVGREADGVFAANPLAIAATGTTFISAGVVAEQTGFHARFNQAVTISSLTLLADASGTAPSVLVTGPGGGTIDGSVVADADGAGFHFVAAAGALAPGAYSVVVRSAVLDARGEALDGAAVGAAGNDERFSVTVPAGDLVTMPSFMRGPGQAVSVPVADSALPVSFTSGGEATRLVFTTTADPALLAITGAKAGAGLPAGSIVAFDTQLVGGQARATITVTSPTPIPAGTVPLVLLQAAVPASAPYGSTQVLALAIASVNGVAQALPASSALQVVGYLGDADGSGTYSTADGARILRVVGGADRSFAVWSGISPAIVADLNQDGALTVADAALVGSATLPAMPGGVTLVTSSPAPFVSVPAVLSAAPGGTITAPLTISRAAILAQGSITLRYDPAALDLTAVRADPASGLTVTAAPSNGSVTVTVRQAANGTSGVLALFDFNVHGTVQPGTAVKLDVTALSLDGRALVPGPGSGGTLVVAMDTADTAGDALSRTRAARARLLAGAA